ncbi:MAG: tripartite tricarboxylate transporter TctB family protein [SAR202 cluster bacterium]|nr:tripartite tricarboxylate transporter TctB family protein [SAR202 cluster bacterium]
MQKLLDRDFLTFLMLLCVYAVFSTGTSIDAKDWIFPLLANYVILTVAVVMILKFIFMLTAKRILDIVELTKEDRVSSVDVLIFFLIVLAYMFVMYGFGFWLSSWLMLVLSTTYLTLEKTLYNIGLAVAVPLTSCILFYFVFLYFFYVPFPRATWWIGFMPD